jgi:hypothetical protein
MIARYAAAGIGAVALLWLAYSWAHERGQRSRDNEVATLAADRDVAKANADLLEVAIARQSDAIKLAEVKSNAAQDMAAKAVRTAQERDKALAGVRGRLDAVARSGGAVAGCETPSAVVEAWGRM